MKTFYIKSSYVWYDRFLYFPPNGNLGQTLCYFYTFFYCFWYFVCGIEFLICNKLQPPDFKFTSLVLLLWVLHNPHVNYVNDMTWSREELYFLLIVFINTASFVRSKGNKSVYRSSSLGHKSILVSYSSHWKDFFQILYTTDNFNFPTWKLKFQKFKSFLWKLIFCLNLEGIDFSVDISHSY